MPYFPGPFTLQYATFTDNLQHLFEVNCDLLGSYEIGDAPSAIDLRTRAGTGVTLQAGADALWGKVRAFFATTTLCSTFALYKRTEGSDVRTFVSGGSLTVPNGSNVSAYIPAQENCMTFRPAGGSVLKIVLLETSVGGSTIVPLTSTGITVINDLATYITGTTNFVTARNRSFPIAPLNLCGSQNEKVFNRRYRS